MEMKYESESRFEPSNSNCNSTRHNNESLKNCTTILFLASPLPFLYYFNSVFTLWNLDAFHYLLFQLFFVFALPALHSKKNYALITAEPKNYIPKLTSAELLQTQNNPVGLTDSKENLSDDYILSKPRPCSIKPNQDHRFTEVCTDLFEKLKTAIAFEAEADIVCWEIMTNTAYPIPIAVYRDRHSKHKYRMECAFDGSPDAVYKSILSGKDNSSSSLTSFFQKLNVLENLDLTANVLHLRTVSMWPTLAREAYVLQSSKKLPDNSIMTVFKSVPCTETPHHTDPDVLRMDIELAGGWFRPVLDEPNKCLMVSYFDGDLKGWIPNSLATFAASNFLPKILGQINRTLDVKFPLHDRTCLAHIRKASIDSDKSTESDETCVPSDYTAISSKIDFFKRSHFGSSSIPSSPHSLTSTHTFWEKLMFNFSSKQYLKRLISSLGSAILFAIVWAVLRRRYKS